MGDKFDGKNDRYWKKLTGRVWVQTYDIPHGSSKKEIHFEHGVLSALVRCSPTSLIGLKQRKRKFLESFCQCTTCFKGR